MKLLLVALAFVVCVNADVSELGYNYHEHVHQYGAQPAPLSVEPERSYIPPAGSAPTNTYVPPAQPEHIPAPTNSYVPPAQPEHVPAASNSYLAPEPSFTNVEQPVNSYVSPQSAAPEQPLAPTEEIEQTPEDGYQYKTVRRVVYKNRA